MTALSGGVEVIEKAKRLTGNEEARSALERLEQIYQGLKELSCEAYVSFDLGMLSKYNYYTGIIFRAYSYGYGEPIVKGGRYDTLLSHFGRELPAVGFAIVIDQLMRSVSRNERARQDTVSQGERYLTIALTKGRLAKKTLELLEQIGITCEEMKDPDSRKLIFVNEDLKLRFFLAKGPDVPTYVELGAADIGVVGKDTILEENRNVHEVLDLGFGKCRMCVCGPEAARELLQHHERIS